MEINDMLAPPPVKLPEDPAQAEASNFSPQELAAKFPASPYAWAELAESELKAAQSSSDTTAEPAAFITAYASTGEPLECAGAFTLEAIGGWFIDRIEGDPSSVIGLSLPVVRRALYSFGLSVSELWNSGQTESAQQPAQPTDATMSAVTN